MANNGISADKILDSFPLKEIIKHSEKATFQVILDAHNKLKAIAESILADISGGYFGLLGLIIPPRTYETLMGSPFVKHTNPETHPIYPTDLLVETAAEILRQHKVNQGEFHTMQNTDLALTKKMISTFDSLYIIGTERIHIKFLWVPSIDIIQHLYNNYGTLNQVDIDDNDKKMSKHYDPTLPIKILFGQIE